LAGFPGFRDFDENAGDESEKRIGARKETNDASSFFDLSIDIFAGIGGAETLSERFREGKDLQTFWDIFFGPSGESWLGIGVFFDESFETLIGVRAVVCVENGFDFGGYNWFQILFSDIFLSIFLKMKLAALPGSGVDGGFESRFETGMSVRSDEFRNSNATIFEVEEKIAPVDFGLRESTTDPEDHPLAVIGASAMSN